MFELCSPFMVCGRPTPEPCGGELEISDHLIDRMAVKASSSLADIILNLSTNAYHVFEIKQEKSREK